MALVTDVRRACRGVQSQLNVLIRKMPFAVLRNKKQRPQGKERTPGEAAQRQDGAFWGDFLLYEP